MPTAVRARLALLLMLAVTLGGLVAMDPGPARAGATTYTVNESENAISQGDGTCDSDCTLREAILAANANPGADNILFTEDGADQIILPNALPQIDGAQGITIDGAGVDVMIAGFEQSTGPFDALFVRSDQGTPIENVSIRNLSITNFDRAIVVCAGALLNNCSYDVSGVEIAHIQIDTVAQAPVLLRGTNISDVTIDDVTVTGSNSDAVDISATNDVTDVSVTNSLLDGRPGSSINNGVRVSAPHDASGIIVNSNTFRSMANSGISISAGTASGIEVSGNDGLAAFGSHLRLASATTSDVLVSGNSFLGFSTAGAIAFEVAGNATNLVLEDNTLQGGSYGVVYRTYGGDGNVIRRNTVSEQSQTALLIDAFFGHPDTRVTLSRNSIFGVGGKGIVLADFGGGANTNDPGDTDTGPNGLLNFPVIAADNGAFVTGTTCAGCLVELFVADAAVGFAGDGQTFIADDLADGAGNFSIPICDENLASGIVLTSTATDPDGNTSQFSANYALTQASANCPTPTPSPTPSPTPVATDTPTPTATPEPEFIAGDLDCDGDITPLDALIILLFLEDLPFDQDEPCPDPDEQLGDFAFADVNCDGSIDGLDILAILAHYADVPISPESGCPPIGEAL